MGCSTVPRAARKCFPSRPSLALRNDQCVLGSLARLPEGYGTWRAFRFEPLHISDLRFQPSKDEGRQVRPDLRAPQRTFLLEKAHEGRWKKAGPGTYVGRSYFSSIEGRGTVPRASPEYQQLWRRALKHK